MTAVDDLRAKLANMSWLGHDQECRYQGAANFVLVNGREYMPQKLPPRYRVGIPRACFHNAYERARRRGLVYVEGYAVAEGTGGHPSLHAWCVEPGSNLVIDVTWGQPGVAYLGVPFLLAFRRSQGGSVLDNWEARFPLFRAEMPEEEWRYDGCK